MEKILFDERLEHLISAIDDRIINKVTPLFSTGFHQESGVQSYKPRIFSSVLTVINDSFSDETVLLSKKILLLGVIINNWHSLKKLGDIGECTGYLERVYHSTDFTDQVSLNDTDAFWKDLAIARLQFFPIKAGVVEYYSGFGFRQGLSFNLFSLAKFLAFTFKSGRKPYYRTHLHTPVLENFSELGWQKSYLQIADMLKKNSLVKGLVRTSWYFDPKIKVISPHLSYLQDLPLKNGAWRFCLGLDQSGCALLKSKARVRLFNEGKYKPMDYLLVWPREKIIEWSERKKEY